MQNFFHLTPKAQALKSEWINRDRGFFQKYGKDKRAMEIINALAELIANFNRKAEKGQFIC